MSELGQNVPLVTAKFDYRLAQKCRSRQNPPLFLAHGLIHT